MKVLVGGTFNAIHLGHLDFLKQAKAYGTLVVVIAHDAHNQKQYRKTASERKALVELLHIADHVVIGDDVDYWKIVEEEKPNIILLGYDQELPQQEKGNRVIERLHIKIVRAARFGTYATRDLERR